VKEHTPGVPPVNVVANCLNEPDLRVSLECLQGDVHRVVEGAKHKAIGLCVRDPSKDCAAVYFMMGEDLPDEREQKRDALKGIEDHLGESLTMCLNKTDLNEADHDACLATAREDFRKTTGKADSELNNIEFEKERRGAGDKRAAEKIHECFQNSAPEEREKCYSNDARKAAALASGLKEEDISNTDLKRAVEDRAKQFLGDKVSGCVKNASTSAKKSACVDTTDELKELIADTRGKSRDEIKDSEVKHYMKENKEDSALLAIQACGKTTNQTLLMLCREDAKQAMADASGKDEKQIPDIEFKMDLQSAMNRDMARFMIACMRAEDTQDKESKCQRAAKEKLEDLNVEEFKGMVTFTLEQAAEAAVKEATKLCDANDCSQEIKEAIARTKGKRVDEVTKLDEKATQKKAAEAASVDDVRGCNQAREVNANATCDGFYEKFLERSGKEPPKSPVGEATDKHKVALDVAKSEIQKAVKACFLSGDKNELKDCLKQAEEQSKETVEFVMIEGGIKDPSKRQKKEKIAEHEAKTKTLGELFHACMLEVNATAEDCKMQLAEIKNGAEIEDSEEDVLDGYYSFSLLTEPVGSCNETNETEMKDCRRDAKAQCLESGMKDRREILMQKLAQIQASAKEWAYCFESLDVSIDDEPECKEFAKKIYKLVRGVLGENFDEEALVKIKDLASKIANATELKLQRTKEVVVSVKTNETKCNKKVLDKFKNETRDTLYLILPASEVLTASCEMVDEEPEYNVKAKADASDDQAVQDVAEQVSKDLADKSFEMPDDDGNDPAFRRLAEAGVTQAFAAQNIDLGSNETGNATRQLPGNETGNATRPLPGCVKLTQADMMKIRNAGYEPVKAAQCNR